MSNDKHSPFNRNGKTWAELHSDELKPGQKIADAVARNMGSWNFIIIQTLFVAAWMILNLLAYIHHWDPYPFILLNLLFSTQAAYAAPIIMMAQNRQSERDRAQALADYETNLTAKKEIEALQAKLSQLEVEKLDKIIEMISHMN